MNDEEERMLWLQARAVATYLYGAAWMASDQRRQNIMIHTVHRKRSQGSTVRSRNFSDVSRSACGVIVCEDCMCRVTRFNSKALQFRERELTHAMTGKGPLLRGNIFDGQNETAHRTMLLKKRLLDTRKRDRLAD